MPECNDDGWQRVAASGDVVENVPVQVRIGDTVIALFRVKDSVFATDDTCTHEFASMSDGYQEGEIIECPLHQACFHIPTGEALSGPAEGNLKSYETREKDDGVFVRVV